MPFAPITTPVTGAVVAASWGAQVKQNFDASANAVVAAPGDLVVATGPGALARLPVGAAGQVLRGGAAPVWGQVAAGDLADGAVTTAKIGDGQVTAAKLAAGVVALSSARADCTADTACGTSYTDVAGCTLALGAGTWLITAAVQCNVGTSAGFNRYVRLFSVTDNQTIVEAFDSGSPTNYHVHLSIVITLAATKTVRLQGMVTSNSFSVLRLTFTQANLATTLCAVKVG